MQPVILMFPAVRNAFIFEVVTTTPDETFTLPLESAGTYDFHVNWGDDNSDDITAYDDSAVTHIYALSGTHLITITGTITGWSFNNLGDKLKIYDIKSWGPFAGLGANTFYGCSNMTCSATGSLDTSAMINMAAMFRDCSSLTSLDVSGFDTANVTSMVYMFQYCSSLTDIAADNFNIVSVTDFTSFLLGVTLLTIRYSNLLINYEAQVVNNDLNFHGGNSKYSAGAAATARADLIADHNWTITDGGPA